MQKVEQTLTLQGQVHRDAMELGSSGTAPTTASNREETDKLTGRVNDSAEAQKLSGATSDSGKFSLRGRKLTSEDYRNLNYGILGIDTFKYLWGGKQTIDEVYPGCPAALAGIQVGDVEVQADDHVWKGTDFSARKLELWCRRSRNTGRFSNQAPRPTDDISSGAHEHRGYTRRESSQRVRELVAQNGATDPATYNR